MSETTTIRCRIHFRAGGRQKTLAEGPRPAGRIPRVARLMALAIHLEDLVHSGQVEDFATLASVGHVSRARMTQITNLTVSVHFAGRVDDWEESEMRARAEVQRRYVSAVDGGPVA